MKIKDVYAASSLPLLTAALQDNLLPWFGEFSRQLSLARQPVPHARPAGEFLPFGAFSRQMRAALLRERPPEHDGVATGSWLLPCGISAAAAWQLTQEHLLKLRLTRLIHGVTGQGESVRALPVVSLTRYDGIAGTARKHLTSRTELARKGKLQHDPLTGINRQRLRQRLEKANAKGDTSVRFLLGELTQLRDVLTWHFDLIKIREKVLADAASDTAHRRQVDLLEARLKPLRHVVPRRETLDPLALANALVVVTEMLPSVRSTLRHLNRLTPEALLAQQRAAARKERKLLKKAERRLRRTMRKRPARANVVDLNKVRAARVREPVVTPEPVLVTAEVIPLDERVWQIRRHVGDKNRDKADRRRLANFFRRLTPLERKEAQELLAA